MKSRLSFVFSFVIFSLVGCATKTPLQPTTLSTKNVISTVAFGSCADQAAKQTHWAAIEKENPQLFLFIGDNVYGDVKTDDKSLPELTEAYNTLGNTAEFITFRSKIPILPTWDDHDYGQNDMGADFILRPESEQLFLQFWEVPADDERRKRDGIYTSFTYGIDQQKIQIILLDTRTFRGQLAVTDEHGAKGKERYIPTTDTTQTMLGEDQWRWLTDVLSEPADIRLLVSSVQIIATDHGFESWALFPHEKQRLGQLLESTKAEGVIILSGDRHIGALYQQTEGFPYPTHELTSSSLNNPIANKQSETLGLPMVGSTITEANFGLIKVNWTKRTVVLALKGMNGNTLLEEVIPFPSKTNPHPR